MISLHARTSFSCFKKTVQGETNKAQIQICQRKPVVMKAGTATPA